MVAGGISSASDRRVPHPFPKRRVGPKVSPASRPRLWKTAGFSRASIGWRRRFGEALETYRFHEAAHVVYHFFWGEYCDWYLELIKPRLLSEDREQARAAYANLISIFEGALRMLSPFMPFITEELWHAVYDGKPPAKSIALARISAVPIRRRSMPTPKPRWRSCRT